MAHGGLGRNLSRNLKLNISESKMAVKIKDWNKYQHYKNRRPPWIRFYRDILDDPDFYEMSGDDFKSLTMLWLIASEDETLSGELPASKKLAFRLRIKEVEVAPLLSRLKHWLIIDDSTMLASCVQDATPDQNRSDQKRGEEKDPPIPPRGFQIFWEAYPKKTGKQAAFRAWKRAIKTVDNGIILAALRKQREWSMWRKNGGQYIPNPSTWLNQGRWEDEENISNVKIESIKQALTPLEQMQERNKAALKKALEE